MADTERDKRLSDARAVRAHFGPPSERAQLKQLAALDQHARAFIALSPFLVIASANANGETDATPRGDAPGFVTVLDEKRLLLPDRPGNRRVDTLLNIVENPWVGLLFFVPGINETLRVNGRAEIVADQTLLKPLAVNNKVPQAGLLVAMTEVFFHCGKALIRSDLWNPERQIERRHFPSLGRILADQIPGLSVEASEQATEEGYRTRLY